jgi:hypothetical protein
MRNTLQDPSRRQFLLYVKSLPAYIFRETVKAIMKGVTRGKYQALTWKAK